MHEKIRKDAPRLDTSQSKTVQTPDVRKANAAKMQPDRSAARNSMSGHNHDRRQGPKQQLLQTETMEMRGHDSGIFSLEKDERRKCHPPRHGPFLPSMRLWWFEVLGMVTSVSALLAIFGILFAYSGEPLSAWKAELRPNTIVAVLSTLSKSAMLMVVGQCIGQLKWLYFAQRPHPLQHIEIFDDASRGPLGSAKLLVHVNWTALLASLGAIITLLSLAMDPFVQQVMSYDAVTFNDTTAQTFLSTARAYDTGLSYATSGTIDSDGSASSSIGFFGERDPNIAGAIYKGVFGDMYQSTVDCASGNCTWAVSESLGICSSCVDVTAATKTNCTYEWLDLDDQPRSLYNRACSTRTPLGINMESMHYCQEENRGWSGTVWNASAMIYNPDLPGNNRLLTKDGTIATIASVRYHDVTDDKDEVCQEIEEINAGQVLECSLKWCVKTYNATAVQNGILSDAPSKTEALDFVEFETCNGIFDDTQGFDFTISSHIDETSTDQEYRRIQPAFRQNEVPQFPCPVLDNAGDRTQVMNAKLQKAAEFGAKFQQAPNVFLVNDRNTEDLQTALSYIFQGGLTSTFKVGEDSTKLALSTAHESNEFEKLMERVADSMTNSIRITPNGTRIDGMVHRTEIRIIVHWPWMALPGAIVLFSIGLLSISIMFSHEKSRAVWKSSLLAALFHGLQGWTEDEIDTLDLKEIELRAKKMRTGLKNGYSGSLKLVKHE